jgi:hypothetical protein
MLFSRLRLCCYLDAKSQTHESSYFSYDSSTARPPPCESAWRGPPSRRPDSTSRKPATIGSPLGALQHERIGAHLRLQQMTGRAPRLVDLGATIDVELISQCHSRSIRISLISGFKYLRTEESRKSFSSLMPGQERNRYFGGSRAAKECHLIAA